MPTHSQTPPEDSSFAALERRANELRRKRSWFERLLGDVFPRKARYEKTLLSALSALGKEAARDRETLEATRRQAARLELLTVSLRNALRASEATVSEHDQASAERYDDLLRRVLRFDQLANENRGDLAALGRVQARAAEHLTRIEQLQARTSDVIQAELAALRAQQEKQEQENVPHHATTNDALADLQAQALRHQQALAGELAALVARLAQAETENHAQIGSAKSALADLQSRAMRQQRDYEETLGSFRAQVALLAAQVAEAGSALPAAEFASALHLLDQRLQAMESERVAAAPSSPGLGSFASRILAVEAVIPALQRALADRTSAWSSVGDEADAAAKPAFERFYLAFEDRYRGSQEEIASRQKIYLPYLEMLGVLRGQRPGARLIDLGCGRGEWLQLLLDAGATGAMGVDHGAQMIALCRQRGLPVEQADALDFLRRQPDRSLAAVTALHLVEHLPFLVLLAILGEARRVLEPGGLLMMETPNCGNLLVASQSFHLDPTHRSPVPPLLLSFSVEHAGFKDAKTLLLHPYSSEHRVADPSALADRFNGFFYGPQDYAVVAHNA